MKSIEQVLDEKYGHDQYEAWDHSEDNRAEIEKSNLCACWYCGQTFGPTEIVNWIHSGTTACCPKCGLGCCVLGSASGLPLVEEFLKLVRLHWTG